MSTENVAYRNEVRLAGTLAKDPVIRHTASSGKAVASLTIATKYKESTEFHKVTAWEKLAEKAGSLAKGDFVKIVGRLQTRSWDDKTSGQKKYMTEVVAFQVVVPGQDVAEPAEAQAPTGGTAIARAILAPPSTPATPNIHGVTIDDSDIPF